MHRYRLFGRVLETERAFGVGLIESEAPPDLRFTIEPGPRSGTDRERSVFSSIAAAGTAEPWLQAFATESGPLLRFAGLGCFEIEPRAIRWYPSADSSAPEEPAIVGESPNELEILFLGTVFALWLERWAAAVCLHASAVATRLDGIGFLGFNRAGKTTLATEFLASGEALITDDLLVVEPAAGGGFIAQPSYPQIRLWPMGVAHFVGERADLPRVHSRLDKRRVEIGAAGLGNPALAETPLRALILPERSGESAAIELQPLTPREAAIELVRHSFLGVLGEAAVGVATRFERIVAIADRVPVFRLAYPDGLIRLPRVREAILDRLRAL